ncbi:flagellar assembly protein FliW [Paenibacillus sp. sgz5001063]|uniref:flagellar assembly protein FliW n=1 Tax=Paenibacillus sp. sgz5001063 TaxID=3242474 RepID=UPI0036D39C8B
MLVKTARFGDLEVNHEDIWSFNNPILGFETNRRYINIPQDNSPFEFFQSVEDEHLTFIVTDPFNFCQEYAFTLEQHWLDSLHLDKEELVAIRSIVTVRSSSDISINLKAPIVMNARTKEAAQIILDKLEYSTRFSIIGNTGEEAKCANPIEK